ncbi:MULTISPECIES: hypothetical protein [unclassified Streptomyces]|uniref:hypothetical protein n=1 Tax=unclassified Streptomyces TaxID=2593676 RepID=UPI000C279713|nr:hypothetical protein [Streptomyces sp. CB02959]PJN40840.1 hypothetical protein CG747_10990 [Streptomyces sp. CB02959]
MGKLTRIVLVGLCVLSAGMVAAPAASAQGQGCRYYYTSWGRGPHGETTGSGEYAEGDRDPEGRICRNGWWVEPDEGNGGGLWG